MVGYDRAAEVRISIQVFSDVKSEYRAWRLGRTSLVCRDGNVCLAPKEGQRGACSEAQHYCTGCCIITHLTHTLVKH